jgi:hypothetical protein
MTDQFLTAYVECAIWADTPDGEDWDVAWLALETREAMARDCAKFAALAGEMISGDLIRAGHDFWLTRQGHGAGFWDGDWPQADGARLTDLAHAFGPFELYLGDDGQIWAAGHEGAAQ